MNRQKSYANWWHRAIEFEVDDKVFFRVSPTRAIMRFWKKAKLVLGSSDPRRFLSALVKLHIDFNTDDF